MSTKTSPIRMLVTWTAKPGQTDALLSLGKALAEEMRASEPDCRAAEFFLGADGKTIRILEEYKDNAAFRAHLASPSVAGYMPKFMALATGPVVEVLGETSPDVTKTLEGFRAAILRPKAGFSR